jgi:hypothetical protein
MLPTLLLLVPFAMDPRIIGGTSVTDHLAYPFVVSLQRNNRHICGGALIDVEWVLTAAHCVHATAAGHPPCDSGGVSYAVLSRGVRIDRLQVRRTVQCIRMHERYNATTLDYDVALLRLDRPVEPDGGVVRMANTSDVSVYADGARCVAVGWGDTDGDEDASDYPILLQEAHVRVMGDCGNTHLVHPVTRRMFCAGAAERDTCQGDSGGPLVATVGGRHAVIGVVSWGVGCGIQGYPGVYANVLRLADWIARAMLSSSPAPLRPPISPPFPPGIACTSDTCASYASDGECDDGGPGAQYALCDYGTDCADCGARRHGAPPPFLPLTTTLYPAATPPSRHSPSPSPVASEGAAQSSPPPLHLLAPGWPLSTPTAPAPPSTTVPPPTRMTDVFVVNRTEMMAPSPPHTPPPTYTCDVWRCALPLLAAFMTIIVLIVMCAYSISACLRSATLEREGSHPAPATAAHTPPTTTITTTRPPSYTRTFPRSTAREVQVATRR